MRTTYGNRVEEQCIGDYIGLSQQEAELRAKRHGYAPKITSIDGEQQVITMEGSTPIYLETMEGLRWVL